ncbi:hypothetical protein [Vampirovibrio chlorellavorus]|uniref:hypothetical protein n=1 Tax=Vampirovibrio chlorellavorus TaxID=758823 RepID=UPI0026F37671|nr:hypothetical protein [Vampirovibrio chlorellavorus]
MQPVGSSPAFSKLRFGNNSATVVQGLASGLQRIIRGQPGPATSKAIEISFRPLMPLIVAGSGLLYNQGRESLKGSGQESNAWLRILGESTLAYGVLANTTGLYPLLGIALAAYRAGKEETGLGQVKALVNTATTLTMGYAGVKLFKLMAKVDGRIDNEILYKSLGRREESTPERQVIQEWLEKLSGHGDEKVRGFGATLKDLAQELDKNVDVLARLKSEGRTDAVLQDSRGVLEKLKHLKEQAYQQFTHLEQDALKPLQGEANRRIAKNLMSNIRYSQSGFVKGLRALNPVLGYVISGLMIGAPVAALINRFIEKRYPELQQKRLKKSILPPEHRIWSGGGRHYAGDSWIKDPNPEINIGPTLINTGNAQPAIFWPGMNNNRPLQ